MVNKKWTKEHIQFLEDNYKKMSFKEMAKFLNRSYYSVQIKANRLGLKRRKYYDMSKENHPNWKGGVTFHKCLRCNKTFRRCYSNAKYCNQKCKYGYEIPNGKITKRCLNCNKEFKIVYSKKNSKFCSLKCAYGNRESEVRWKEKRIIIKCHICNREFKVNKSKSKTAKYCSKKCKYIGVGLFMKNRELSKEHLKKLRENIKKLVNDPRRKEWTIKNNKKMWQNKDYREKMIELNNRPEMIKKRLKALLIKPNKPEKKLIKIIKDNNFPFKYVGNGEIIIGKKNPDFINYNGEKQIIELFGKFWHDGVRNDNAETRINHFSKYGFKTLIIWDYEVDNVLEVENKIRNFIKNEEKIISIC